MKEWREWWMRDGSLYFCPGRQESLCSALDEERYAAHSRVPDDELQLLNIILSFCLRVSVTGFVQHHG